MKNFNEFVEKLSSKIKNSYEDSITIDDAEKLAAEFLHAQLIIAQKLKSSDLDARMRKSGFKAVAAAVYIENATKNDKKPSDVMLNNIVEIDVLVQSERKALDEAEVAKQELQNYFDIFKEAHIYYRGIAKGKFE